ncbi:MAG: selenocysteine-specific translation elongation factor [Planctomycetota bacterium]|nr:selenocysteine-specific translation elongation factor [Planctomycetota bacterium]
MSSQRETIFNVVLGTAGHIDHGKSSLVKSLTGVDPDRLPEEKSRGLTIDLGFAPLELRDGRRVGIVDVPGHERLIKNMVAGATGIDLVLLVVAADDGVMPQTREHLTIMQILDIRHGVVAITKIDLVEEEMRELVREEIQEVLEGTSLEGAPVVEVSSVTGDGIDDLVGVLHDRILELQPRPTNGIFRMPVQRVFSLKGFGTVLTGIPVSGEIRLGDTLEVAPLGERGRVRGIEAYKQKSDSARAGHSSAINLTDIDYRKVRRGMVLCEPGYFEGATMFEARLHYLPAVRRPLLHQTRVRLHVGTVEALGRVFILDRKRIDPGEESLVQFRLDEPMVAASGDRYVLRLHSPMETIGGGEILDRSRWRLKSGKSYVIEQLEHKRDALGDPREFLLQVIDSAGYGVLTEKEIALRSGRPPSEVRCDLEALEGEGRVRRGGRAGRYFSTRQLEKALREAREAAASFYTENPRRFLHDKAHLRQRLKCSDVFLAEVIGELERREEVETGAGGQICWRDHGPRLSEEEESIKQEIASRLQDDLFTPPSPGDLSRDRDWDARVTAELYDLLSEQGELQKVADGIYFHRQAMEEARGRLREFFEKEASITAADAKNLLSSTRKYSIPLLEQLDRESFTVRRGDVRVLKEKKER